MSEQKPSTPSVEELMEIFSRVSDQDSLIDGLVYSALGFVGDGDYVGLAHVAFGFGGIEQVAEAEARLRIIGDYDCRRPEGEHYSVDKEARRRRTVGINAIVKNLDENQQELFYNTMDDEMMRLEFEHTNVRGETPRS